MAENYCGKSCEACDMKEKLSCSGCKAGPGRMYGGECPVAKCCQERGHNTCATCNQNNWCAKQQNAKDMAKNRLQKQEWERKKQEQLEKWVPLIAKCLTAIFWLSIISLIPGIMSNDLTKSFPILYQTGQILNTLISLAIVAAYFCMGGANDRYRKVAVFMALTTVGTYLQSWVAGEELPGWTLLLKIFVAGVGLMCRYHLCTANSEVLVPVDYTLSEQWMKLWKWYMYVLLASIVAIVIGVIIPVIGALIVVVAGIGTIVLSIVEIVYFCRMMICFRTYARRLNA